MWPVPARPRGHRTVHPLPALPCSPLGCFKISDSCPQHLLFPSQRVGGHPQLPPHGARGAGEGTGDPQLRSVQNVPSLSPVWVTVSAQAGDPSLADHDGKVTCVRDHAALSPLPAWPRGCLPGQ